LDLSSKLRAIVRSTPKRELTYEPDTGRVEATVDLDRVAEILGGRPLTTSFGNCLAIDRRYESNRWHGDVQIGDCDLDDCEGLQLLDPKLSLRDPYLTSNSSSRRTVFIDLETTGLSGGAGTVAFLVGCGYFDLGAFQVRQFLLTSYASERALLSAVTEFFGGTDLIVTYNGKTFDVPVMETRWSFHRLPMPDFSQEVPHFDMLHPARRLWSSRNFGDVSAAGCRLTTLETEVLGFRRHGDVGGFEIPARYFQFLRTGDPRPLEPVLEHNRLDLVSLAAVTGHARRLARAGDEACRNETEALALGRVLERALVFDRAESCYRRAAESSCVDVRGEALYRLGLRYRRERRFAAAARVWRDIMTMTEPAVARRKKDMSQLRQFAAEALAIHHEHRERDLHAARELALFALNDDPPPPARADGLRHRLARLDRKIARGQNAELFFQFEA
jgi:uncharacterized protein YprB with RNaseH-like and TPR domain